MKFQQEIGEGDPVGYQVFLSEHALDHSLVQQIHVGPTLLLSAGGIRTKGPPPDSQGWLRAAPALGCRPLGLLWRWGGVF